MTRTIHQQVDEARKVLRDVLAEKSVFVGVAYILADGSIAVKWSATENITEAENAIDELRNRSYDHWVQELNS